MRVRSKRRFSKSHPSSSGRISDLICKTSSRAHSSFELSSNGPVSGNKHGERYALLQIKRRGGWDDNVP